APVGPPRVPTRRSSDLADTIVASANERGGRFSPVSTAAADAPDDNARRVQQLFIQVGAFSEHGNAEQLVERLRGRGFDNVFVVRSEEHTSELQSRENLV